MIRVLIGKYERGECSEDELELLHSWYNSLGENDDFQLPEPGKMQMLKSQMWQDIAGRVDLSEPEVRNLPHKAKIKWRKKVYWAIAAGVSGVIFMLAYGPLQHSIATEYTIVTTHKGEIRKILLSDHTTVWLNSASILRYPKDMSGNRKLFLDEGEAFFDVTHNELLPFVVQTRSGMQTQDLGTAFSVKAYRALPTEKVTVLQGKVKVVDSFHNYGILLKGQGADINVRKGTGISLAVDSTEVNGWVRGQVMLNNVSFLELAVELENTFGVTVRFRNEELKKCRSSISFSRRDSLTQVMEILKTIYKIDYHLDEDRRALLISGQVCNVQ